MVKQKAKLTESRPLITFFILTFAITWGLGAIAIFLPEQFQRLFGELTDTSPIYFFAIAAPSISATILTSAWDGWQGLKSLYARLVRWHFDFKWYLLVLLGIPVVGWIAAPARVLQSFPCQPDSRRPLGCVAAGRWYSAEALAKLIEIPGSTKDAKGRMRCIVNPVLHSSFL